MVSYLRAVCISDFTVFELNFAVSVFPTIRFMPTCMQVLPPCMQACCLNLEHACLCHGY